jgi:hypothetical protein
MALDLKLIKRKWKLTLLGWFALLILLNVINIAFFAKNSPVFDSFRSDDHKLRVEGNFCPGGYILFSMSPVESINGWHKSSILVKPVFENSQQQTILPRIVRSLKSSMSDGIFGFGDIPSYQLKEKLIGGISERVNLQIEYLLPENDIIIGETILFEMECEVSYPYQSGKNEYSVNNTVFKDQIRIRFHEKTSSGQSPETMGLVVTLFIMVWFIGLFFIYRMIKRDPY